MSLLVCGVKIILWGKDWGKMWGTESNKITKALNALMVLGAFVIHHKDYFHNNIFALNHQLVYQSHLEF